jgi:type I restriction enzyme M protein
LWFLSRSRAGGGGFRKRKGEVLFIDGRKLGALIPGSRKQKQLTEEEIEKVAAVYRKFRRKGIPEEVPGFCRVATLDKIRDHKYALTPGRYVGSAYDEGDGEPIEEKLPRLTALIKAQMQESQKLDQAIDEILAEVGNGT